MGTELYGIKLLFLFLIFIARGKTTISIQLNKLTDVPLFILSWLFAFIEC